MSHAAITIAFIEERRLAELEKFPSPTYFAFNELGLGKTYYFASGNSHESFLVQKRLEDGLRIIFINSGEQKTLFARNHQSTRFGRGSAATEAT